MTVPSDVLFFNKDGSAYSGTSSKRCHFSSKAYTAILKDGLLGNRPSVAQTILWVANRATMRVEDGAHSPGREHAHAVRRGMEAFYRLQLAIIRMFNDKNIFAWVSSFSDTTWIGGILAENPSFFEHCSTMELMDHDELSAGNSKRTILCTKLT